MFTIARIKSIIFNKYFLLIVSQLVIIYVAFMNRLPAGYIVSGGDASQVINWPKMVYEANHLWSSAACEGIFVSNFGYNLYYYLIYLLSSAFHISLENQASLNIFLFLSASFWSFYFSFNFFDLNEKKISDKAKVLFSLAYAFNAYTLHYFTGIWGYGPQFLFLYVLVPILFSLTYRYFSDLSRESAYRLLPLLGIFYFISNISNGNLAFFVAHNILVALLIVLVYLYNRDKLGLKKYIKYALVYYLLFFVTVCWTVIPQIQEMGRISNSFVSGSALFDLKEWILWQAANIPTVFYLGDPVINTVNVRRLTFLSGGVFFTLLFVLGLQKKVYKQEKIFLLLLISAVFLLNKGIGVINNDVIWAIFKNPVLGSLRSYDKAAIFTPFLILIPTAFIFPRLNKIAKYFLALIIFASFLSVSPFIRGNIQTIYSMAHQKGQNYMTAKYSSLVKIPNEYREAANKLNKEESLNRIVSGPYSVVNSAGWANFPKWKLVGVDPTVQLFNKSVSQMNAYAFFDNWNYGKLWDRQTAKESEWMLPFLGLVNDRYFIFHKDIEPKFIEQTTDKISYYVSKGYFSQVESNDYFDIYKLSDKFYLPLIYTPKITKQVDLTVPDLPSVINLTSEDNRQALYFTKDKNISGSLKNLPEVVESAPTVEYRRIAPTKYRIRIHGAKGVFPIVFSETYGDLWKLYFSKSNNSPKVEFSADKYKITDGNESDQATSQELSEYVGQGLVSNLGKNSDSVNFVSKNFKGTIQNNNLPSGQIFETLFRKPLSEEYTHSQVNGYANSWLIDSDKLCSENNCEKNSDGFMDFELILELWPQRLYYIFGIVSLSGLLASVLFLVIRNFKKKNGKTK